MELPGYTRYAQGRYLDSVLLEVVMIRINLLGPADIIRQDLERHIILTHLIHYLYSKVRDELGPPYWGP